MANLETLELRISANAQDAAKGLGKLVSSLLVLKNNLDAPVQGLKALNAELEKLKQYSGGAFNNIMKNTSGVKDIKAKTEAIKEQNKAVREATDPKATPIEPAKISTESRDVMAETASEIEETNEGMENTKTFLQQLREGFANMTKGVTDFFSKVKRIATTMLIRAALKGLIRSVKEGISNLYQWSKVTGGSFANSMDQAKAKLLTLKNSLGAAISPVIQSLIPLFNTLANAIISVANKLNQFFSLLSGKNTWTQAVEQNMDDVTESTNNATKAAKEALAAFDELNVLPTEGGGGGTTATQPDYSGMFEEVAVFDSKIKDLTDYILSHLDSMKAMAVEIGLIILGWKISQAFEGFMSTLGKWVAIGAIIALTVTATWSLTDQYLDTGDEGWLLKSVLVSAVGATAAGLLAKKLIGGQAALYAAGITLALTAVADIVANVQHTDVSAFSKESILTNIKAAIEAGAAVGILLKATGAFGLGTGGILLAAGGAALLVFGIATLIKVLTQNTDVEIDPNLVHFTEEEARKWAATKMFTMSPDVVIDLTHSNIEALENSRALVEAKLEDVLGTLRVVKLGLANADDFAELKNEICGEGGLIDKIHEWINESEQTSKLVLTFTPKLIGETEAEQQAWYIENQAGWDLVKEHTRSIGEQLATELAAGEEEGLKGKRLERVNAQLEEMARIAEIIAGTDTATNAQVNFEIKLQDLDKSSIGEVLSAYSEYKKEMVKAAEEMRKTAIENQIKLINALKIMLEYDPDNPEIKQSLAEAEEGLQVIKDRWKKGVEETAKEMAEPGAQMIREWISNLNFDPGSIGANEEYRNSNIRKIILDDMLPETEKVTLAIGQILYDAGLNVPPESVGDFLKFGGWDLLSEDFQKEILTWIKVKPSTVEDLKNVLGFDASKIFTFSNWNTLSLKEKMNFLQSMNKSFGSKEVLSAAKSAGVNVGELVAEGMKSEDPDIRTEAVQWTTIITKEVDNKPHEVPLQLGYNPVDTKKMAQKFKEGVQRDASATAQVTAMWRNGEFDRLKSQISAQLAPEVQVRANVHVLTGGITNFIAKIHNELFKKFSGLASWLGVSLFAGGGFPQSGQLFIANEDGNAELVGKFGNNTAVANQEQMVDAMAAGVYKANEEQNALLLEQNNLLRGILAKEGTVRLSASSALGRTVKQSLSMYGAVTGG